MGQHRVSGDRWEAWRTIWVKVRQIARRKGLLFALRALRIRMQGALYKAAVRVQDRFNGFSYPRWAARQEADLRRRISADPADPSPQDGSPFLSLISLEFSGAPDMLSTSLAALQAQTQDSWEWCLVLDPACPLDVRQAVARITREDPRIHVVDPGSVGSWIDRFLAGLQATRGEWVLYLAAGDVPSPFLTAGLRRHCRQEPDLDILYFDEDHLAGKEMPPGNPVFKPSWSPELLLSLNYLDHAAYRRKLALASASSLQGSSAATLWGLALHASVRARRVGRIPLVLYHRAAPQGPPDPTTPASHLQRHGTAGAGASLTPHGTVRLEWPIRDTLVSIVIPTRDRVEYLKRCIESVLELTRAPAFEILLLDNQSSQPETLAYYAALQGRFQGHPRLRIVPVPGEFNYSSVNNRGARLASGDLLLFLNNDVQAIEPDWLAEMARWAQQPEIGIVGAKLLYPDRTIQHAGIVIGLEGHANHLFAGVPDHYHGLFGSVDWYRNVSAVTGACMMLRREVFEQAGGFDEGYRLAFSDIALCQQVVRHGYRVLYNPFARLIHYEGRTRSRHIPTQDMHRAASQLCGLVEAGDPYFHPGLSHAVRVPTLRRPNERHPLKRLEELLEWA